MILSLLAIFSWCVLGTNMVLAKLRPKELAAVNRRLATIPDRVGGVNLAFVEYGGKIATTSVSALCTIWSCEKGRT